VKPNAVIDVVAASVAETSSCYISMLGWRFRIRQRRGGSRQEDRIPASMSDVKGGIGDKIGGTALMGSTAATVKSRLAPWWRFWLQRERSTWFEGSAAHDGDMRGTTKTDGHASRQIVGGDQASNTQGDKCRNGVCGQCLLHAFFGSGGDSRETGLARE
jgi:hypothetical protein